MRRGKAALVMEGQWYEVACGAAHSACHGPHAGLADVQSNGLNISQRSLEDIWAASLPPGTRIIFDMRFNAFTTPPEGAPGKGQVGRAHMHDAPASFCACACSAGPAC